MARALGPSLLDRVSPNRARSRSIPWPLDPRGDERVDVRLLSDDDLEAAHLAAEDYCSTLTHLVNGKRVKRQIGITHPVFQNRDRAEKVWRAFSHEGVPLAPSVDDLVKQPGEVLDALFLAWVEFQREAGAVAIDDNVVGELIDGLKKNIPAAALAGLPSTWLIALITTLAAQLCNSTTTNDCG